MAPKHQKNCECWSLAMYIHAHAARIPWMPERPISKIPFCRSAFYKNFIVNGCSPEAIKKKFKALYVWDVAFPIFLAGRYHSMKSVQLQKSSTKAGYYFFNAIYFIQSITNHSSSAFYRLSKGQMIIDYSKRTLPSIFAECKPDLCKTAAEFLLEPWVLLQLPFQPALLHQWAVAALAETLRFCKRLVEIGTRGYAPQFHDLYMKLAKLSQTLARNCNTLLSYFFNIQCKEPTETVHVKILKMRNFPKLLAEALTILEFVFGAECTNIIDSIKESSWGGEFSPEDLMVSADLSEIGLSDSELGRMGLLNIYSLSYWTYNHPCTEFCLSKQTVKKMQIARESTLGVCSKTGESATLQLAREIISRSFNGFRGTEIFLAGLKTNLYQGTYESLLRETKEFCKWKETSSASEDNENGFGAIINDILGLQSDVLVEKALGKVTRQIWLAAKKFDKDVHLKAKVSSSGEQRLSIQEALDKITSVLHCQESWTFVGISRKAKATCAYDKDLAVSTEMETELAVDHISTLTRALVMKFYERQYTTLPGLTSHSPPFKHYPDCVILQYIFPCFTAMYLELFGNTGADDKAKKNYHKFLMALLSCFESEPHIEELGCFKKQFFHQTNIFYTSMTILYDEVELALENAFKCENVNFFDSRDLLIRFLCVGGPPDETPKDAVADSFVQLYRLLCRLKSSLQDIGMWLKEPAMMEALVVKDLLSPLITLKQHASTNDKILFLQCLRNSPSGYTAEFIKMSKLVERTKDISYKIKKDSLELIIPQLFAISLYEAWSHQQQMSESQFYSIYQGPLFTLDRQLDLASQIVSKDWWGLKNTVRFFRSHDDNFDDISLIPIEVAKNNLCCKPLIKALTASNKVPMEEPGQVTFFPIKHCRWCGAVYASQFRLCAECKDEPYYPHPNYFCSKKCEKLALGKFHTEEHARFIMGTVKTLKLFSFLFKYIAS